MSPEVAVGRVIASRYQLEQQLGKGGMGSVWRAVDRTLGSPVAIKLIDPELAAYPDVRERFHAEARAAAALRSPHVVQILDHGVDGALPFIAMELLEGETLATRLERSRALSPPALQALFADVARALRKAHEAGIVHRDLKPDNIFLVHNDGHEIAKVLDFGIAKQVTPGGAQSGRTRTGAMLGTLPYMSPEQAQGTRVVDHRTDLWALGVIAFECLCGKRPFDSDAAGDLVLQICARPIPVPSAHGAVPPGFDAWFARATSREVESRFQSVTELMAALAEVLTPGAARPAPEPGSPPVRAPGVVPAATAEALPTMSGASMDGMRAGAARPPRRTAILPAALGGALVLLLAPLLFWALGARPQASAPAASEAPPVQPPASASVVVSAAPPPSAPPSVSAEPATPTSAAPDSKVGKRPPEARPRPADRPSPPGAPPPSGSSKDSRIGF